MSKTERRERMLCEKCCGGWTNYSGFTCDHCGGSGFQPEDQVEDSSHAPERSER